MMLLPFRTNAAAQALCIELLEAGACIFPTKVDGCMVTFIPLSPKGVLKF
jgi:hypothetical protein